MEFTRREMGWLALALPAARLFGQSEALFASAGQARPNSKFNGVQIGTITYSYRSMPDQSAEAILKYVVDSGISAIELMGGTVDTYAQQRSGFTAPGASGRGGFGAPGPGGPGGRAGRGAPDPATLTAMWNGQACAPGREGGAPGGAPPMGGGAGRSGPPTAEQTAADQALSTWRQSLSMNIIKDLRKMYNDAGVTIYAVRNLNVNASDEELEFEFAVAKNLGATHITNELPAGPDAGAILKRVGEMALTRQMFAAYHTHAQGSMNAFDEAFAASKGNKANVDLGHFVAGGNKGGTPIDFLNKFHDRIASFHLKDRTLPEHCALNLPWGQGETPIKEILRLVRDKKWPVPATIEQEYAIPAGSDAVKEVTRCVQYCKNALTS